MTTERALLIIVDKTRAKGEYIKRGVGVVRDLELKVEDVEVSHKLGEREGGT